MHAGGKPIEEKKEETENMSSKAHLSCDGFNLFEADDDESVGGNEIGESTRFV